MKRLSLILAALFIVSFVAFAEPAHQNDSPTVAGYTLIVGQHSLDDRALRAEFNVA